MAGWSKAPDARPGPQGQFCKQSGLLDPPGQGKLQRAWIPLDKPSIGFSYMHESMTILR